MPAIFDHHLDDMTAAVLAALKTQSNAPLGERIRGALASCWVDTAAITWTASDIRGEYPALSQDEARDVLVAICDHNDASVGVCWDNLGPFVRRAVPDYDIEREDDEDASGLTDADRQAAYAATGYGPDVLSDDQIVAHLDVHVGVAVAALEVALRDAEAAFARRGGRGVLLADKIDGLRIALAVARARGNPGQE
jgi:hypothetical protein